MHAASPSHSISKSKPMGPVTCALLHAFSMHTTVQSWSGEQIRCASLHESGSAHLMVHAWVPLHWHLGPSHTIISSGMTSGMGADLLITTLPPEPPPVMGAGMAPVPAGIPGATGCAAGKGAGSGAGIGICLGARGF